MEYVGGGSSGRISSHALDFKGGFGQGSGNL